MLYYIIFKLSKDIKINCYENSIQTCAVTISIHTIPRITSTQVRTIVVYTRGINWAIIGEVITFIVICIKREIIDRERKSSFSSSFK